MDFGQVAPSMGMCACSVKRASIERCLSLRLHRLVSFCLACAHDNGRYCSGVSGQLTTMSFVRCLEYDELLIDCNLLVCFAFALASSF